MSLVGNWPIPTLDKKKLINYLSAAEIEYHYELNSKYDPTSIYANFKRELKQSVLAKAKKDPLTGKIYKNVFLLPYKNRDVYIFLTTYPYRNGCKAVMNLTITGSLTSTNKVDFKVIIKEVKKKLRNIVNS